MWTRVTAGRELDKRGMEADGRKPCIMQTAGSMGRQRKARTSRLIGNHIFWGDKCPGSRQRKVEKGQISSVRM